MDFSHVVKSVPTLAPASTRRGLLPFNPLNLDRLEIALFNAPSLHETDKPRLKCHSSNWLGKERNIAQSVLRVCEYRIHVSAHSAMV